MFSDYLYFMVSKNLITNKESLYKIFPDMTDKMLDRAVGYIKQQQPIKDNNLESTIARFLFAKTLKQILEDPTSTLSIQLEEDPKLRKSLKDVYSTSIQKINKSLGRPIVAEMPGVVVVPNLDTLVGGMKSMIGKGAYGTVYTTAKGYAVKKPKYGFNNDDASSTVREVAVMRYLNHPNVMNITFIQLDPTKIAMPLATGTLSLKMDLEERKWIFYQLFRGIAYCHSKYVWHLDLKQANILLFPGPEEGKPIAKIADFGLALPYATRGNNSTHVVTLWWRAPELLLADGDYTELVDIWSLGVMLLDTIQGRESFEAADSEVETMNIICEYLLGRPNNTVWPGVEELPGWKMVSECKDLSDDGIQNNSLEDEVLFNTIAWPTQRSSALEILRLPYFDSVRDKVEIDIPAEPITIQSCARLMTQEQEQPLKTTAKITESVASKAGLSTATVNTQPAYNVKTRTIILKWMRDVKSKFRLTEKTFLYAVLLLDLFMGKYEVNISRETLQLYAIVCLHIASLLYQNFHPEISDWLWMTAKAYTRMQFDKAVRDVLKQRDFNLIIPSCHSIIREYVKDENITTEQYERVLFYSFVIMLNYDYATEFTQVQISQIAISAAGLSPECLKDVEPIYDQQIYDNLKSFNASIDKEKKFIAELHNPS